MLYIYFSRLLRNSMCHYQGFSTVLDIIQWKLPGFLSSVHRSYCWDLCVLVCTFPEAWHSLQGRKESLANGRSGPASITGEHHPSPWGPAASLPQSSPSAQGQPFGLRWHTFLSASLIHSGSPCNLCSWSEFLVTKIHLSLRTGGTRAQKVRGMFAAYLCSVGNK